MKLKYLLEKDLSSDMADLKRDQDIANGKIEDDTPNEVEEDVRVEITVGEDDESIAYKVPVTFEIGYEGEVEDVTYMDLSKIPSDAKELVKKAIYSIKSENQIEDGVYVTMWDKDYGVL